MTRFEMTGTIVSVMRDNFYVEVADETVIRVVIPPYADKPQVGGKATVAIEVH